MPQITGIFGGYGNQGYGGWGNQGGYGRGWGNQGDRGVSRGGYGGGNKGGQVESGVHNEKHPHHNKS
jgi:hypothetical protein